MCDRSAAPVLMHPAVLAAARLRCSVRTLLTPALPFGNAAVPSAVIADCVAPFLDVSDFSPATFPRVVSVLDIIVQDLPVSYFEDRDLLAEPYDVPSVHLLRTNLERWSRPLVSLTVQTLRAAETVPFSALFAPGPKGHTIDVTCLRSLSLHNATFPHHGGEAIVHEFARRCLSLTSLQFRFNAPDWLTATFFATALWPAKLRTLALIADRACLMVPYQLLPTIAAHSNASSPFSPANTVETLRIQQRLVYKQNHFTDLFAAFRAVRRLDTMSNGIDCPLLESLCQGSLFGSRIEHFSEYFRSGESVNVQLQVIAHARRMVRRWQRDLAKAKRVGDVLPMPPTRESLGLTYPTFHFISC